MRGCMTGTRRGESKVINKFGWNSNSPMHYCSQETKEMREYMIDKVNEIGHREKKEKK